MEAKRARRRLYRNGVSYAGGVLTTCGVLLQLLALLLQFSVKHPGPYFGIFTYVGFPAVIILGSLVFGLGMWWEARRRRRRGIADPRPYPVLDFNDPKTLVRVGALGALAAVAVVGAVFSGYNGFLLTESVGFCGATCHGPMGPEMTAYLRSPHARVPCVACHVGEGAGPYVQSKMNGVRQLAGVVFNNYDRPIPAPIKNLRPARETCETCHWSRKYWGSQLYQRPHFRYDETSTPEQLSMLVKTGGGDGPFGAGIHWHMAVKNEVTFVAQDAPMQDVPWVRSKRPDGSTIEFFRTEKPIEPDALARLPRHTMDCIDCHNRPAHEVETPDIATDRALAAGVIPRTLPWVKSLSVESLAKPYASRDAAHAGLRASVASFYAGKYPDVVASRGADVESLVRGLIGIYDSNVFPEMKVSWSTYPSNIGHRNSAGCFRCHDGKHVAPDGQVLVSTCDTCHTLPKRGPQTKMGEPMTTSEGDWHPWVVPEKHLAIAQHKDILCHECHLDGRKPKTECNECHSH